MAMDEAWRGKVRERAYAIWLRQGSPEGQAEQFWLMAEEELLAEGQGRASAPPEERPDRPPDGATVDEAVGDSFPASDPPARGGATGAGAPAGAETPNQR
jgi:Protein of unknown function (DUF2934)